MSSPVTAAASEPAPPTRDRLLEAARSVFTERGYEGTRVQEVARRAGLTTGAIYANFRDKDDLLLDAIAMGTAEFEASLVRARRAGASVPELLEAMGRGLRAHEGDPGRFLLVEALAAARRSPGVAGHIEATLAEGQAGLVRLLQRAKAEGTVAEDLDVRALARLLQSIALGYYLLESAGSPGPDLQSWTQVIERVVASLNPS